VLLDMFNPCAAGGVTPVCVNARLPGLTLNAPVPVPVRSGPDAVPAGGNGQRPEAASLPIPGYDALSASQVVQRLPALSADELEAVRTYESSGRGRKTILHRVAQLQSGASS
jgi:hypothetical protein